MINRKTLSNLLAASSLAIAMVVGFGPALVYGKTMTVKVNGLRSSEGVVHVLVYDNAKAFSAVSATDLVNYATQPASASGLVIKLNGMQSGNYALMLHHDENNNNEFEMDGDLPLEGWGYSNNAGREDTPSFKAATFPFDGSGSPQLIRINYAN